MKILKRAISTLLIRLGTEQANVCYSFIEALILRTNLHLAPSPAGKEIIEKALTTVNSVLDKVSHLCVF